MLEQLNIVTRICLIWVFLAASVAKLHSKQAWRGFSSSLQQFGFQGRRVRSSAAGVLIFTQIFTAGSLAIIWDDAWPLMLSLYILIGLSIALYAGYARQGKEFNCHCFGEASRSPIWVHFGVNCLLILSVCTALLGSSTHVSVNPTTLAYVVTGAALGALITAADYLYATLHI